MRKRRENNKKREKFRFDIFSQLERGRGKSAKKNTKKKNGANKIVSKIKRLKEEKKKQKIEKMPCPISFSAPFSFSIPFPFRDILFSVDFHSLAEMDASHGNHYKVSSPSPHK